MAVKPSQSQVDWQRILQRGMLDIFAIPVPKKPKTRLNYDFAFQIGNVTLLLLVGDIEVPHTAGVIDEDNYQTYFVNLAQQLAQRHKKCLKNLPSELLEKISQNQTLNPSKYDSKNIPSVFFIALSSLVSHFDGQKFYLGYEFNSPFFDEKFVFDRENESQVLQFFSLQEWQALLECFTPTDFTSFLKYHRHAMLDSQLANSSITLAEKFLQDRVFFERAWQVEKALQKFDFLPRVSPQIKQAIYKDSKSTEQLRQRLQRVGQFWLPLIEELIHRQEKAQRPISLELVQRLALQSSYTRLKILEPVLAYPQLSDEQKQAGLLYHEHSYHDLGQHFIVIIYGSNPSSDFYPMQVYQHYREILQNIADKLPKKGIHELFLLGFNLLHKDTDNNPFIEMDVFYQSLHL